LHKILSNTAGWWSCPTVSASCVTNMCVAGFAHCAKVFSLARAYVAGSGSSSLNTHHPESQTLGPTGRFQNFGPHWAYTVRQQAATMACVRP
jgi:hypothetical protein